MNLLLGTLMMWGFGLPIYLPWVLSRLGYYKKWYFTPFIPPFALRGWIQVWPMSLFFVGSPFLALLPLTGDQRILLWGYLGIGGFFLAIVMIIWTPRCAKPPWQRHLENLFSHEQISAFIVTWRKMPFSKWCEMIDTEKGMLELVDYALENHTQHVDPMVTLRMEQLDNAKKRRLKQKPKWLFQDEE